MQRCSARGRNTSLRSPMRARRPGWSIGSGSFAAADACERCQKRRRDARGSRAPGTVSGHQPNPNTARSRKDALVELMVW